MYVMHKQKQLHEICLVLTAVTNQVGSIVQCLL